MTESEHDPESESSGVGKLNGINQRDDTTIFAF